MAMPTTGESRRATVTKPDGSKMQVPLRRIAVSELTIDSLYQRDLDQTWVQTQVRDGWDEAKSIGIIASARGGRLLVIDGQHRVELARQLGVPSVWVYVKDGMTQAQEAELFEELQTKRRALKIWERFKARTAAQKKDALEITTAVHKAGFRIDRNNTPGTISAIGALTSIYKLGDVALLTDTLTTIRRLWTLDDSKALSGQVMHGIAIFLHSFQHQPQFRMERLDKVLPATAPLKLLRLAQDIASRRQSATVGPGTVGEALRDLYNKGVGPDHRLGALTTKAGKRMPGSKP